MKTHTLLIAVLFASACAADAQTADPGEISMYRGGPAHAGVYPRAGRHLAGLQWTVRAGGDISGSIAVVGAVAYVGSGDGALLALDLETGRERWRANVGSPIHSTPAVGGGFVFVAGRDGRISAFDSRTGEPRWTFETGVELPLAWGHESGDIYISSPALVDGRIYVGAGDGGVHALEAASGRQLWRASTGGRVRSSPAVAGDMVYVGSMDGVVHALRAETGEVAWTYRTLGAGLNSGDFGFDRRTIQSSPAVVDGVVYVGARDGFLYALDAATGELRWSVDHNISWVITSPAVADGVVYAGSSDALFVQALDAQTGTELWRTTIGAPVWSSPIVSGDQLIFGESGGRVLAVDRANGTIEWAFRTPAQVFSAPVIADSLVLAASIDGRVYALRTTDGPPVQRAMFFDTAFARTAWHTEAANIARYLGNRGYDTLDAPRLADFMQARISDGAPSVVVFAIDHLPPSLQHEGREGGLLRAYLEAGGKVVWPGIPPALWPRDPVTGAPATPMNEIAWPTTTELLGVDHDRAIFGQRGTRATAAGRRWGLADPYRTAWGVDTAGVTEVLGLDEFGLAGAWVRSWGGPAGTGFVRLDSGDLLSIYHFAEYRPR